MSNRDQLICRLVQTLRDDLRSDTERGRLVRSTVATALMKTAATGSAFAASLLYARVLGPHDYGLYAYVIACTAVLTIPAGLGLPQYLVREGAKLPGKIGWLLRWSDHRIIITGMLSGLLLACAVLLPKAADARWLFVLAAPIPLLTNLSNIRQALLQAQGWIVSSQWPQLVFTPLVTLLLLSALWIWRGTFHPADVVIVVVLAALAQLAINALQLRSATGAAVHVSHKPAVRVSDAIPFMWVGALYLVMSRIDLILLGSMKGAREAGIYAIASRAAEFVPFFLAATNTAIAPKISHLYHAVEHMKLQRLATAVARRLLWTTLPIVLVITILAHTLIQLFYGAVYVEGTRVLQILALAQFFTIVGGPVGALLNMTDHAGVSAKALAAGVAVNVAFNLLLIPKFGYTGAACATTIGIAVSNSLRWYFVRHYLGIKPSAFGI